MLKRWALAYAKQDLGNIYSKYSTWPTAQGQVQLVRQLQQDGMDATLLAGVRPGLLDVMVDAGLAASRGAARKLVQGNGVRVNGATQTDFARELDWSDALFGRFYLLRRGKKSWHLLVRDDS